MYIPAAYSTVSVCYDFRSGVVYIDIRCHGYLFSTKTKTQLGAIKSTQELGRLHVGIIGSNLQAMDVL
jgi:hypothetical protein